MKALVLGGTQFVGLRLVELLHRRGHDVTVLNRGHTPARLPDGVGALKADRNDAAQVAAALRDKRYDAVFDISGYTATQVEAVLEALVDRVGHYVFCSSTSVYAAGDLAPVHEDSPLSRGPDAGRYASDKIACEDLLMDRHSRRGLQVTVLRPPYVYGPHNVIKEREFAFFARLTQGRKLLVPDSGVRHLHFVQVDDMAAAFIAVPGRDPASGQAYTVCGDQAITANGFVRMVEEIMGVTAEVVYVDTPDYGPLESAVFPFGVGASLVHSNEKARRDLDWTPQYSMRDGLAMTYRWWLEQGLDKEAWDFSKDDAILERVGDAG